MAAQNSTTVKSWVGALAIAWACASPAAAPAESDCFAVTRELRAQGRAPAAAESTDCWYTIHVHAVRVTDFCPTDRATEIDPGQVAQWIDKANEVYAAARVRFEFDPTPGKGDWMDWNQTDVNDLVADRPGDPTWERGKAAANQMASHYPDKVLVLFRHGPGPEPAGGGFSGDQYGFVVMPAFRYTAGCGEQNINLFAHELGHYLGLKHTFQEFRTVAEAELALKRAKLDPRAFDGDGIEDTAPDPYIEELGCGVTRSVVLQGVRFALQRENVMSYYFSRIKIITPQQAAVVRATVERRFAQTRANTGPYVPDERRVYQIASVMDGKVLEAGPASPEGVAGVRRGSWVGAPKQEWKMIPLVARDIGWFEIVSPASGKCLTVDLGSPRDGVALVQTDWSGANHQKWRLRKDEKGDLLIEAKHSRKVLTVPEGAARAGRIEQATDKGSPNQRWRVIPAD